MVVDDGSRRAPLTETPARVLCDDAEAIAVAERLAADFCREASERDRDRRLVWAELDAAASIAVAEAKVPTTEIALQAGAKLFELAGKRSALASLNLDRRWRDAPALALHDPVRWKANETAS